MYNTKLAEIFNEIANMLDLEGEERHFEVLAYRKAALIISTLQEDVGDIYARKGLEGLMELSGVGKGIAGKIEEYMKTGKMAKYEELKKRYPIDFANLTKIQGMGAKKLYKLYQKLGVKDIETLKEAVEKHRISGLEGFGEKSEQEIAKGMKLMEMSKGRMMLGTALPEAESIRNAIEKSGLAERVVICGSTRRMKETVGDLDILVISEQNEKVMDFVTSLQQVGSVILKGPTKTTVWLKIGLSCDIRIVEKQSLGAAMQYFTGNKDHNVKTRQLAIKQGYKLSEYGLFDPKGTNLAETEEQVYNKLGLDYIEPEMREDRGELELAAKHKLPKLITIKDIAGDLHVHSKHTDGTNTIEEMASAAQKLGYRYIGMTDHSKNERVAKGMDDRKFNAYFEEIDRINDKLGGKPIVLKSGEVDILKDGTLDLSKKTLSKMDYVLLAVHTNTNMPKAEMTKRIIKAVSEGYPTILAHPTDRLVNGRRGIDADFDRVFEACADNDVVVEIDAYPERLDLNDENILKARRYKLRFSIDTDAHDTTHLAFMRYGIGMAKRGWLTKRDVINTLDYKSLKPFLSRG